MTLKLTVEKLEEIPEALRAEYVEDDGKFRLDVEGIEDTAPLKAQIARLNRENGERRKKVEALSGFEKLGKTPEELEALVAEHAELKEKIDAGHDKQTLDQIRREAAEAAQKQAAKSIKALEDEKAALLEANTRTRKQYEDSRINTELMSAISKHKGRPNLLVNNIRPLIKAKEEDGRLRLLVLDDEGEERTNGKGDLLTVDELVAEMSQKDEWAAAFEGSGNSGGGQRPAGGGANPNKFPAGVRTKRDLAGDKDMSYERKFERFVAAFPTEQAALDAYQKLPD